MEILRLNRSIMTKYDDYCSNTGRTVINLRQMSGLNETIDKGHYTMRSKERGESEN